MTQDYYGNQDRGPRWIRMPRSPAAALVLTGLAILGFRSGADGGIYSVTGLGYLPGTATEYYALNINDAGAVVGICSNGTIAYRAYTWTEDRGITELFGQPGTGATFASSINEAGQIVGWGIKASGYYSILWQPASNGHTTIDLGDINAGGSDFNGAGDINSAGRIVGSAWDHLLGGGHGFLWQPAAPNGPSGALFSLGGGGGTSHVAPSGINDQGDITGVVGGFGYGPRRAFLWKPVAPNATTGTMHLLDELPTEALADDAIIDINDLGQILGQAKLDGINQRVFVWNPTSPGAVSGTIVPLGTLPGASGSASAGGMNEAGVVVGGSAAADGASHAFIWDVANGMQDLNDMLDASGAGWTLRSAGDINNNGWITGYGIYDPDGPGGQPATTQAYLLRPVPEPGIWGIVAAAMAVLRRRSTRRKSHRRGSN